MQPLSDWPLVKACLEADQILVATGRQGNTGNLNLESAGIDTEGRGYIPVDETMRTNTSNIFAAGDVTTVPYKQIVISMGEGSKASLAAFEYLMTQGDRLETLYEQTQGNDAQQDAAVA